MLPQPVAEVKERLRSGKAVAVVKARAAALIPPLAWELRMHMQT